VDQSSRELTLRTLGRVQKVRDFEEIHVANRRGVPVKLGDLATVADAVEEPRSLSRLNGENSVSLVVR
jgi:HAE1 family hydrophobic/amphiphilic exporter-1